MVHQVIWEKWFLWVSKILSGFSFIDFFLQVRPKRSRLKPRPRPRPRWWPRRPRPGSSSRTPPWSRWFSRCCLSWRPKLQVRPFVYKTLLKFVLHGTEVAFLLLTQRPWIRFLAFSKNLSRCCWDLSTGLVIGKWSEAWQCWANPSSTG